MLTATARRAFDRLAGDLARVFADRFVSVVASGPATSVAFARAVHAGDLEAFGELVATWHREGLETPLLLTPDEFRRSLDAFPVEYQAVIDRHLVIAGTPPFAQALVPPDALRRACEIEAKSHLLHLRQGWIEARGHDADLAALIARSAAPLRALLANVARLSGVAREAGDAARDGGRLAGLPDDLIDRVLALEAAPEHAPALVRRLPEYLAAAERLWTFVDTWRS
jgi:hypothetical protein